jgi:hypothetical protein
MRPSRRALVALALAGSMTVLSACAALSPNTTDENYDAANGVTATLGSVIGRDLVVIGDKGKEGLLSGGLVNRGQEDVSVVITAKGQPQPVTVMVPSGGLVTLGSGADQTSVVVGNLTVAPGALLDVTLSSPPGGQVVTAVPVLTPTAEYATVTPTAD